MIGHAAEFLDRVWPPAGRVTLPTEIHGPIPGRCAALGIEAGAVYDALVVATAVVHDAVLLTRERRAMPTYRLIGATTEMAD